MTNKRGSKNLLTKKQVFSIPKKLPQKSIQDVADEFGVSWQAVWYWIRRLRSSGINVKTPKRGQRSKILETLSK